MDEARRGKGEGKSWGEGPLASAGDIGVSYFFSVAGCSLAPCKPTPAVSAVTRRKTASSSRWPLVAASAKSCAVNPDTCQDFP